MRYFVTVAALCGVACAISNYTVDPTDLSDSDKSTYCNSQFNTCSTLCDAGGDGTAEDSCDPDTLDYVCTCNNGSAPGLEYYINSMDTILCQKSFELCIEDTVGDSAGQAACTSEIKDTCGTLDPNDAEASNSGDATATSGGDSATATGDSASSTETADSGAMPNIHHYGNAAGAIAIGLLAYML